MDMKGIQKRVGWFGESTRRLYRIIAAWTPIVQIMNYIARFGAGFLLARAIVFGEYAPFGIAFSAALGVGNGAAFGLLGAVCGYLSILHKANGLKYTAICVLIYTAGFVFRDTALCKKRWFMPLAAAISTAAIGFVFVADAGFQLQHAAFYLTEIGMTVLCSYFYQFYCNGALAQKKENDAIKKISTALLIATLVIPLTSVTVLGNASIGRSVAVLLVMLAGYYGGSGLGSAAGIALGLAVSITGGGAHYCAIYGFCGLLAALFCGKGKLVYAIVYLMVNAVCMLWVTMGIELPTLYEAFFASVFFLPISEIFGAQIASVIAVPERVEQPVGNYGKRVRKFAEARLASASEAFEELSNVMENTFRRNNPKNIGNIATVFDAPAQHICKKCTLANACWERDYITTRDALNGVTKAMQERGQLEAGDFPVHFSSRCIKIEEFIAEVNRELAKFLYRKQCHVRVAESRRMVRRQYHEVSNVFEGLAKELAADPQFDERAENRILELLNQKDTIANPCVYRDMANHIHVEIEGRDLSALTPDLEAFGRSVAQVLGVSMTQPTIIRDSARERIAMRQKEPLVATMGVAVNKKRDTEMSGDSGSYFRMEDGRLCVILADGMGSGRDAAMLSASTISLLERFLRSGINPKVALATINSALVLKSEESGSFTTLDFMQLDLYTGNGEFYKLGSAPSYVKRGRHVRRLCGTSLPAGVPCPNPQEPDRLHQKLHFGDYVIFATDGIADGNDDEWLLTLISEYEGGSAKQLAGEILAGACAKYGRTDDMTVMVIRVDKNE